jgi:hypothetical protein
MKRPFGYRDADTGREGEKDAGKGRQSTADKGPGSINDPLVRRLGEIGVLFAAELLGLLCKS